MQLQRLSQTVGRRALKVEAAKKGTVSTGTRKGGAGYRCVAWRRGGRRGESGLCRVSGHHHPPQN